MNRLFLKTAGDGEKQLFPFIKKKGLFISSGHFGKVVYQEFKTNLGFIRLIRFQLVSEITLILPCDSETLSFHFSLRGSFRFQTDYSTVRLLARSQGKLCYAGAVCEYSCTVEPTAGNEYALFHFFSAIEHWPDQDYTGRMKRHFKSQVTEMAPALLTGRPFTSNIELQKSIWDCLHELQKENRNIERLHTPLYVILLTAFVLMEKQKLQTGAEWDPEEHIASLLAEHIILGMDESWSIQKMARSNQLNPNKLKAIFKKYNGMTVTTFKIFVRLGKAKQLLLETPLRIHEISARVGYPNPAHFSKLFKSKMGFSPSLFRKRTSN